jgi:hypothetical protein
MTSNIKPVSDAVQASVLAQWWAQFEQFDDARLDERRILTPIEGKPIPDNTFAERQRERAAAEVAEKIRYLHAFGVEPQYLRERFGLTAYRLRAILGDGFE